jgi:Protein of unknown function (DUF3703)
MGVLQTHIERELAAADEMIVLRDYSSAFSHLERAHVLAQAITYDHTRIHWRMLKLGLRMRSLREIFGQIIRIVGASTKTPFGIYPTGNTGGANVYFFKPMPIPADLQQILVSSKDSE